MFHIGLQEKAYQRVQRQQLWRRRGEESGPEFGVLKGQRRGEMEGGLKSKRDLSLPKASTPLSFQSYSPCCWPDPIGNLPILGEAKSETEQERGTRSLKITARPWNQRGRMLMDKRSESCKAFPRDQDRKHTVGALAHGQVSGLLPASAVRTLQPPHSQYQRLSLSSSSPSPEPGLRGP